MVLNKSSYHRHRHLFVIYPVTSAFLGVNIGKMLHLDKKLYKFYITIHIIHTTGCTTIGGSLAGVVGREFSLWYPSYKTKCWESFSPICNIFKKKIHQTTNVIPHIWKIYDYLSHILFIINKCFQFGHHKILSSCQELIWNSWVYFLVFTHNPGSIITNHSQEHSLVSFPKNCNTECNTTSGWLKRVV